MDQQLTFADSDFSNKRRQTRKGVFLGRMEKLVPWARLEALIEPHYPKAGNTHRALWAPALSDGDHAPDSLHATVVQPQ
ncbi:hypothetical protein GCM10011348_02040 [Marinobacterium nitratireducens]|uniref:Transposase n=1 Tax=Marinobacterium nitratireducens TaxID=518897 RepID=A0A917Z5W6_9GAMM|nr:hypothetical protein GCM10011348_02040 [Marinobacterium nitratireducens]